MCPLLLPLPASEDAPKKIKKLLKVVCRVSFQRFLPRASLAETSPDRLVANITVTFQIPVSAVKFSLKSGDF